MTLIKIPARNAVFLELSKAQPRQGHLENNVKILSLRMRISKGKSEGRVLEEGEL